MERFDFTTASRSELSLIWKAIAQEMGDDRFFTTKELDHLPRVLDAGEQVLAFSSGLHKGNTWLIVLTDERILFLDKGLIYGLKTSSIELERVNNFDYEKGILFGNISIGSNAEIYEITNVWKKTIEPFTKKLRQAIKAKQEGIQLYSPGIPERKPDVRKDESQQDNSLIEEEASSSIFAGIRSPAIDIGRHSDDQQMEPWQVAARERMKRAGMV